MSINNVDVANLKEYIAGLSETEQAVIHDAADKLRIWIKACGSLGIIALALIATELIKDDIIK